MQYQLLTALVRDRHEELQQTATEIARGASAGDDAPVVGRRPLPLRLLARFLGPR